jgi:hypothetical protein
LTISVTRGLTPHETRKTDQTKKAQPSPIEVMIVCAGPIHGGTTAIRSPGLIGARRRPPGRVSASAGLSKGSASGAKEQSSCQSIGSEFAGIYHNIISSFGGNLAP